MPLDVGGVVEIFYCAAAQEEFFEQTHRERARTDGGVANLHLFQPLVYEACQLGRCAAEAFHVVRLDIFLNGLLLALVADVRAKIGGE